MTFDSFLNELMEAVKDALVRYIDFDGRTSRRDFWYFYLFQGILFLAYELMGFMVSWSFLIMILFHVAFFLLELGLLIPGIAVSVRRLHDVGRPGRDYLWCLVPVAGGIILLRWFIQESQPGTNQYGPNPCARGLMY